MHDREKSLAFGCYRTTAWTTAVAVELLKSLPYSILVRVCKNDKGFSPARPCIKRVSMYPCIESQLFEAGSVITPHLKLPRYFLWFASRGSLTLVMISNVFIRGTVSLSLLARLPQICPTDSAYSKAVSFETDWALFSALGT